MVKWLKKILKIPEGDDPADTWIEFYLMYVAFVLTFLVVLMIIGLLIGA